MVENSRSQEDRPIPFYVLNMLQTKGNIKDWYLLLHWVVSMIDLDGLMCICHHTVLISASLSIIKNVCKND